MATGQLDRILRRDARFLYEIWAWFAAGAVVILLRFVVRLRMVGPAGLKGDDYTMLFTLFLYTLYFVIIDLVYVARRAKRIQSTRDVLTDAAILSLPLPVLREIRVPLYKKMFIAVLICSGLFVIAAAIMRVAVTLGSEHSTITVNRWGVRECEVGLMAINAPILRPLFSRRFWQWNYRPPARTPGPTESTRRSRTAALGRRRRVFKDGSFLAWMNSTTSRLGTAVRSQGRKSPVDLELGDAADDEELAPLDIIKDDEQ
ncbi:hypothetical protein CSHISOI_07531, partial [Colletotrichum shisoi]